MYPQFALFLQNRKKYKNCAYSRADTYFRLRSIIDTICSFCLRNVKKRENYVYNKADSFFSLRSIVVTFFFLQMRKEDKFMPTIRLLSSRLRNMWMNSNVLVKILWILIKILKIFVYILKVLVKM